MIENSKYITGRNIQYSKKGECILYDSFTKAGYLVPISRQTQLAVFQNRFLISVTGLVFGIIANIGTVSSIGIGAILLIILEYLYRMRFLKSLAKVRKYVPAPGRTLADSIAERYTKKKAISYSILLVLFGVLMVFNSISAHAAIYNLVLSAAILAACICYAAIFLKAASRCRN